MSALRLLGIAGAVGAIGAAGASALWVAADRIVDAMTAPSPPVRGPRRGFTPFETGVRWEDVTVAAEDGSRLPAWLFLADAGAPAILACGGYRGRRADLLGISSALWRAGFNVLLFDYRGHGEQVSVAPSAPVTLGYRELEDARAALRFLRSRFPTSPLGTIGFSMGAAVALMLAARESDVRAVIADSPFSTQRDIVRYRLRRASGRISSEWAQPIGDALLSLADTRLRRRLGFRFADVSPLEDVPRLTQPLLLVHGEDDREVPVEHSHQIAAAARQHNVPLDTWFVPVAAHCEAYFLDRPAYCARAAAFFRAALTSSP